MNDISLTIQPVGGRLVRIRATGPSSWAELTTRQTVALMRLREGVQARPELLFAGLKLLYQLKPRQLRWLFDEWFLRHQPGLSDEDCLMLLEQGQNVLDTLVWVGDRDETAAFPRREQLLRYHNRSWRGWWRGAFSFSWFEGPKPGLGNLTFGEFMAADQAYQKEDLTLLAATLYHPAGEPFHMDQVRRRATRFADLDPALLELIRFKFWCTLLRLQQSFPLVFPKKSGGEGDDVQNPVDGVQNPVKKPTGGWLDVVIGMAQFDATKVGAIENINLYLALKVLNEQSRQAEKTAQTIENMKQKNR